MQTELLEPVLSEELDADVTRYEQGLGFFDCLFGIYIIAMLATNYSEYNNLVSNIGLIIPLLFVFSLIFTRYRFQREVYMLAGLYLWVLLGAVLSDYRSLSMTNTLYFMKIQFVMMVVALRCTSAPRIRFYLIAAAIGTGFLVVPSLLTSKYLSLDERLKGTIGEPNALGSMTALCFAACLALLLIVRRNWKWILFPLMAIVCIRVLILTGSRGSALTVMSAAGAYCWYVWRRGRLSTKLFLPIVAAIIVVITFIAVRDLPIARRLLAALEVVGIRTHAGGAGEGAVIERFQIAKEAMAVFRDHPVFGAGYGTFRAFSNFVYTHTTPFEFLFATGIVGTSIYYLVLFSAWRILGKVNRIYMCDPGIARLAGVGRMLIIVELVAGLSLPTHYSKAQAVISGAWLGIAWYIRDQVREQTAVEFAADETMLEAT